MTYDPRIQQVKTIMQMIKQNPFVANKNSMIKPLFTEVNRLNDVVAAQAAEITKLKATPKKKEKKDDTTATE